MNKVKLYQKCYGRIGMKVIETDYMKSGHIVSFVVNDSPDGTYNVYYIVGFENGQHTWLEKIHESKIALMKGSEL